MDGGGECYFFETLWEKKISKEKFPSSLHGICVKISRRDRMRMYRGREKRETEELAKNELHN